MEQFARPVPGNRLLILLVGILVAFFIIGLRLYFLQIMQADFFAHLAQQQYTTTVTLPAQRATLYDRHRRPLALARQSLSVFIDRNSLQDHEKTIRYLKEHFPVVYEQWKNRPKQNFFWLARHIEHDRKQEISNQCPDAHFMFEPSRWYLPPYVAEVTGFTNIDTKGMNGFERWADKQLAGTPTTMRCQKEARNSGLYFIEHILTPGQQGNDVTLSIDQQLQFLVSQELTKTVKKFNAQRACTLVLDPDNGQVLCLAQSPSYNPNNPSTSAQEHRKNHLISSCHEFGSVIKIFSALAALAEGVTTPDELINCEGTSTYIDGFKVENWTKLGTIPFWQVVSRSSNVGIAKVAKRLGPLLYDHLCRLGFSTPTGIELPAERSGFINPPERWSASSPLVLSFGYEIMSSIIQLGKALAVVANGGYAIKPTLYYSTRNHRGMQLYDTEPVAQVKDMLRRAAASYNINLPGYTVMGKTGTARMVKKGKYSNKDHLYTFAGIIEKEQYRRVIITFVENPANSNLWALNVSAPLFARIASITALHEQACPPPQND